MRRQNEEQVTVKENRLYGDNSEYVFLHGIPGHEHSGKKLKDIPKLDLEEFCESFKRSGNSTTCDRTRAVHTDCYNATSTYLGRR